jgi:protein TonB
MNDPVSRELERRAHLDLPWRWAILGALGLHLAVLAALFLAPSHAKRALRLPSVQIRLAALPAPRARASAPAAAPARPAPLPTSKPLPKKIEEPPPKHAVPPKRPAREVPRPAAPPENRQAGATESGVQGTAGTQTSPSGAIALGGGGAEGDETFPFTYYLNRVLAVIESNWFRPPVPVGTRCTVRCVIDRSGRLAEAGLEQESASPAFDRAALRAVYAAAPFPPLPQGYGGATLTLHLEFGQ